MTTENRVHNNLKALRALRNGQTADDLMAYTGWGGLREAIYTPAIFKELKGLIGEQAIVSLKQTLKSAYYTPAWLVRFMMQCLASIPSLSLEAVLEPSAGVGNFLNGLKRLNRPESQPSRVVAVEIDQVSCELLNVIYPDVEVHHTGFERFQPDEQFTLILGNPPFGQIQVDDPVHQDLTRYSIHHYFVAKAMRLLKPNGLLAMVLPRYFLDASCKQVRHIIAKEGGTLVAAFRLPDNLFSDAKVTVDIVFLQKTAGTLPWREARRFSRDGKSAYLNEYFFTYPSHILGRLEFFEVYGRNELTCKSTGDLGQSLAMSRRCLQLQLELQCLQARCETLVANERWLQALQAELNQRFASKTKV